MDMIIAVSVGLLFWFGVLYYIVNVIRRIRRFFSGDSGRKRGSQYVNKGNLEATTRWLERRWDDNSPRSWWYGKTWVDDPPTKKQMDYLTDLGMRVKKGELTKGKVSDLIGLYQDPDDDDIEALEAFGIDWSGMNQTRARYAISSARAARDADSD